MFMLGSISDILMLFSSKVYLFILLIDRTGCRWCGTYLFIAELTYFLCMVYTREKLLCRRRAKIWGAFENVLYVAQIF